MGSVLTFLQEFKRRGVGRIHLSVGNPSWWLKDENASKDVSGNYLPCTTPTFFRGGNFCYYGFTGPTGTDTNEAAELGEHVAAPLRVLENMGLPITWLSPISEPDFWVVNADPEQMGDAIILFYKRFQREGTTAQLVAPEPSIPSTHYACDRLYLCG